MRAGIAPPPLIVRLAVLKACRAFTQKERKKKRKNQRERKNQMQECVTSLGSTDHSLFHVGGGGIIILNWRYTQLQHKHLLAKSSVRDLQSHNATALTSTATAAAELLHSGRSGAWPYKTPGLRSTLLHCYRSNHYTYCSGKHV